MKKFKDKFTFHDYGCEGLLAYKLSEYEFVEPYLICFFEYEDEDYSNFNVETGEYEGEAWFLDSIKTLEEISKFKIETFKNNFIRYHIYKVVDKFAYLNIWSMASSDFGIAEATLSGSSDIDKVISSIKSKKRYDINDIGLENVPWSYSLVYGGGSNEYFAELRTKKTEYLDFIINETNKLKRKNFDVI